MVLGEHSAGTMGLETVVHRWTVDAELESATFPQGSSCGFGGQPEDPSEVVAGMGFAPA